MLGNNQELVEKKVEELNPGSKWFTITVKVLEVNEEKTVFSRRDGNEHRVADALVGDETGTVYLSLWDEDIDKVKEREGSTITIKNGYVTVYKGSMRLSVGRFGQIEDAEKEIETVNNENNISEKEVKNFRSRRRPGFSRRRFSRQRR